jgi:hypothetical protein
MEINHTSVFYATAGRVGRMRNAVARQKFVGTIRDGAETSASDKTGRVAVSRHHVGVEPISMKL